MLRFDHLRLPVSNLTRSRRWYLDTLGLKVEFEVPERQTLALQDDEGFTIWGSGAELKDPDGYLVRLWDERSMKEK